MHHAHLTYDDPIIVSVWEFSLDNLIGFIKEWLDDVGRLMADGAQQICWDIVDALIRAERQPYHNIGQRDWAYIWKENSHWAIWTSAQWEALMKESMVDIAEGYGQ